MKITIDREQVQPVEVEAIKARLLSGWLPDLSTLREESEYYTSDPELGYAGKPQTPKDKFRIQYIWAPDCRVQTPVAPDVDVVRQVGVKRFFNLETGEEVQRRIWTSISYVGRPGSHDVCHYCGTENGLGGGKSLRNGWDCYGCGGN